MVYDFKMEKFRRDLDETKAVRDMIYYNRHKFQKLKDRVVFWFYVKVLNILIRIGEFLYRKENENG